MNDGGFSEGIREIVGWTLRPHLSDEPGALTLVDRMEDEWRKWRATN